MKEIRNIISLLRSKISHKSAVEMSWVITGQVLSVISGFVILKILSSLGKEDFGIYALIITLTVLVGLIFYGPLQQGFLRFYYHYLDKNQADVFVALFYKILLVSGFLFLALILIFYFIFFSFEINEFPSIFLIAGVFIVTFKLNEFFNSLLNLIRKRKENAVIQGLEKLVTIILLIILLYINELTLNYVFIGLIIITSAFAAKKIRLFNKFIPHHNILSTSEYKTLKKEIKKRLIIYASPFLIWGISAWLQMNGEKWIINGYLTTADVGVYAIMMALVNALIVVPSNIISEFSIPLIFKQYADLTKKENIETGNNYIRVNIILVAGLTLIGSALTYLLGEELILIISNNTYTTFWYLLPLFCLGSGLFLTGQAQATLGLALNLPQKYLGTKITTGVLSVALNLYLINHYGIKGVAYTSVIVGVFYIICVSVTNKKILKIYTI